MIVKVAGIAFDSIRGVGIAVLNRLIDAGFRAECIAIGEDFKHFPTKAPTQIMLYRGLRGLDGGTFERYNQAADEDRSDFTAAFEGADIIFVVGDLGDPVGAGSMSIVAECAKAVGALTIAVVTRPFTFEGPYRQKCFRRGLEPLKATADLTVIFSKDQLIRAVDPKTPMTKVIDIVDDVVCWIVGSALSIIDPSVNRLSEPSPSVQKIFEGLAARPPLPSPDLPSKSPSASKPPSTMIGIPSWMRRR